MTDPASASARLAFTRAVKTVRAATAAVDTELARDLDAAEATAQAAERTVVVVVGEVKQGKSTLVNALLGRPGTSPADVSVATTTYLLFEAGERDEAILHLVGDAPPVRVDVGDLSAWTTPTAAAPVRYVDVTVQAPWLGDLVLIDTPGAGGLVAAHATSALEAARRASALLFVTDALAPLSRVELDFLTRAAERVETVVFALTKIGRQPGWSAVLAENRRNVAEVAPRFAASRWVPVDSRLAAQGLDALDGHPLDLTGCTEAVDRDVADALEDWEESGVGELLEVLRTELAPATETLAAANVLRAARSVAVRADRELALRLARLQVDPALEAAVAEHHRRLVALDDEHRTWAPRLEKDLNLLRIDGNRELAARMNAVRDAWSQRLRGLRRAPDDAAFDRLFDELQREVDGIGRDVLALTFGRFRVVAENLFGQLADPESVATALGALGTEADLPARTRLPPTPSSGAKDMMDLYYGWLMGSGLATAAGSGMGWVAGVLGMGVGGPVVWGLGAVGGIAGIALRTWVTRDSARQADLRSTLTAWISQAEAEIRAEVDRNTVEARYYLAEAFRAALQEAKAEAQKFLDDSKAARQQSAGDVAGQRTAIDNRHKTLVKAVESVDALLQAPLALRPGWRTEVAR